MLQMRRHSIRLSHELDTSVRVIELILDRNRPAEDSLRVLSYHPNKTSIFLILFLKLYHLVEPLWLRFSQILCLARILFAVEDLPPPRPSGSQHKD
jgi:hypothetical protein